MCDLKGVGKLTAVIAALAFAMAVATVRLPPHSWTVALYATLVLTALTMLCLMGWISSGARSLQRTPYTWAVVPALLAVLLVTLSFLFSVGPGQPPPLEHSTVDLPHWLASSVGLAGALACIGFGGLLTYSGSRWLHAAGVVFLVIGLFSVQPALKARGLPYLGPLGAVAALLILLGGALLVARRQ